MQHICIGLICTTGIIGEKKKERKPRVLLSGGLVYDYQGGSGGTGLRASN